MDCHTEFCILLERPLAAGAADDLPAAGAADACVERNRIRFIM